MKLVIMLKVYIVLEKWCNLDNFGFEKMYLDFLIFIDEMKVLLICKVLEDIFNLILFYKIGLMNIMFLLYVFEIV